MTREQTDPLLREKMPISGAFGRLDAPAEANNRNRAKASANDNDRGYGSVLTAARAGAVYFVLVFAAGFGLGSMRQLIVAPALGEAAAVLVEIPLMIAVSWQACSWTLQRFPLPALVRARLIMGGTAFALLMLAETGVSIVLFSRTLVEHVAFYQQSAALLGLGAQIVFAALPLKGARRSIRASARC